MFGSDESASARKFVLTLFLGASIISVACRTHTSSGGSVEAKISAAGEPDRYSAVVVRSVEDGASTVTSTSSEARFGERRRVEWTENGKNKAIIWRPDLGKSYVLDLDAHVYTEFELNDQAIASSNKAENGIPS